MLVALDRQQNQASQIAFAGRDQPAFVQPCIRECQQPSSVRRARELVAQHAHERTPLRVTRVAKPEQLARELLMLVKRRQPSVHDAQRRELGRRDLELRTEMPPQRRRQGAHGRERLSTHAQEPELQGEAQLECRCAPLLDRAPLRTREREERLELEGR